MNTSFELNDTVQYYVLNGKELAPSTFKFDNGYITVTDNGSVKIENLPEGIYNLKIKTSKDLKEYNMSTYLYTPNSFTMKYNEEFEQNPNFSLIVDSFSISNVVYPINSKINIDSGYISVNEYGKISFGNFTKENKYFVTVKSKNIEYQPYTINVVNIENEIKYFPQNIEQEYDDKPTGYTSAILGGIVDPKINYYSVNLTKYEINKSVIFNTGSINVNEKGTIKVGGFSQEDKYNISVNVESYGDVPFLLKVTDKSVPKTNWYDVVYFGLKLWIWLIIISVILIITITIFTLLIIKLEKNEKYQT